MSLTVSENLRIVAEKRKRKRPFMRAFLNKLLHPSHNILVYTPANFDNPYQTLLYSGFNRTMVSPVTSDKFLRYQKWGLSNLLHIHWDEDFLRINEPERVQASRESLLKFKHNGGKVIWTVHNQMPHDTVDEGEKKQFLVNRSFLCDNADLIHVHSEFAKLYLLKNFKVKTKNVVVIPHPSYIDWYTINETRKQLNSKKVFILFGNMRGYKGFDLIIDAFANLSYSEKIDYLHIAGKGADTINHASIDTIKIKKTGGYVDDLEVPDMFRSADFAVFGFSSILTSGSLMLAMTFGVPPIAPAHPGIQDSLPEELHDLLYEPNNAEDFSRVIDYVAGFDSETYSLKVSACINYAIKTAPSKISKRLEQEILSLYD